MKKKTTWTEALLVPLAAAVAFAIIVGGIAFVAQSFTPQPCVAEPGYMMEYNNCSIIGEWIGNSADISGQELAQKMKQVQDAGCVITSIEYVNICENEEARR